MKRIGILTYLLTALLLVCSCDDDAISEKLRATSDYKRLALDVSSLDVPFKANTCTIYVDAASNLGWRITDIPTWIKVSPSSGKGYQAVSLTFSRNTGSQRSATLTLMSTDTEWPAKISLKVTQNEAPKYEAVDLGLSVNWASLNVGANSPEEAGNYYAWGEIEPKNNYAWSTYKWSRGTSKTLTKYNYTSDYGDVDGLYELEPDDDVAIQEWGNTWRLPTVDEVYELTEHCSWTWTVMNGVPGYKVESNISAYKGNSIFLPAKGYRQNTELECAGEEGIYWTSDVYGYSAYTMLLEDDYFSYGVLSRDLGALVRPVCPSSTWKGVTSMSISQEDITITQGCLFALNCSLFCGDEDYTGEFNVTWKSQDEKVATVSSYGVVTGLSIGTTVITAECNGLSDKCVVTVKEYNPVCEYVDLGLSVNWATCNVGAESPEEAGMFVSWGETEPKNSYNWNTYKWDNGYGSYYKLTKYCFDPDKGENGFYDNKSVLDPGDDLAHNMWGGEWRIPSVDDFEELINNCTWTWTTQNGVLGYKITSNVSGYTDKSIFLPYAGWRSGSSYAGGLLYWTNQLRTETSNGAWGLDDGIIDALNRSIGIPVRPVCPKKGHEYVDLGLSVKWATCNLGASQPEECGDYYAWGETETKTSYSFGNYKWCKGSYNSLTKYCNNAEYGYNGYVDDLTVLSQDDDVAHVKLGGYWRMPTKDDFYELWYNCTWTKTEQNGITGFLVESKIPGYTDRSIFLPVTGFLYGNYSKSYEDNMYYWSSSLFTSSTPDYAALPLLEESVEKGMFTYQTRSRCYGFAIRPVLP